MDLLASLVLNLPLLPLVFSTWLDIAPGGVNFGSIPAFASDGMLVCCVSTIFRGFGVACCCRLLARRLHTPESRLPERAPDAPIYISH